MSERCAYGEMDWYCALPLGHAGAHQSRALVATPPPEAAEGECPSCVAWAEENDALAARVRALEAALGEACVQIMPLVIQKHGGNAPPDACDRDLCGRLAVWRALLAVRASDARPEGR